MKRDVVILGAGLAGSSLAKVLSELGWDVLLLERRHFPHHKVCGEFLSPESQASLRAMGLYEPVKALGPAPMTRAKLVSRRGVTLQMALPGCAWGMSRFALDAALAAAAVQAGGELQTGVTATSVTGGDNGFEVALRSAAGAVSVQARAIIAACGRYSRPHLPPRSDPASRQTYVGVKCHYENISMPPEVMLFFFPGGYAGVSPIEGNRVNFCLLATGATLDSAGKNKRALLERAVQLNPALQQRLSGGKILPETEVAVAPVDTGRPARPWDGMACLGDTAVMMPPLCGDGMAMALRSAELCAPLTHDFLRGKLPLAAWEAGYQTLWHAEFDRRVRLGRGLQTILGAPILSDVFMSLGRLVPALAAVLMRATRGTPVSSTSVIKS
jgi:flavin-dependent dehydrogenase